MSLPAHLDTVSPILTHSALPASCTVSHRNTCRLVLSHTRPVRFLSISPSDPMIPVIHPNSTTLNRQLHFPPFKKTQKLTSHDNQESFSLTRPSFYFQPTRSPLLFSSPLPAGNRFLISFSPHSTPWRSHSVRKPFLPAHCLYM